MVIERFHVADYSAEVRRSETNYRESVRPGAAVKETTAGADRRDSSYEPVRSDPQPRNHPQQIDSDVPVDLFIDDLPTELKHFSFDVELGSPHQDKRFALFAFDS